MDRTLTDEEVFGLARPSTAPSLKSATLLSDDEVFQKPQVAQGGQELLTDEAVFASASAGAEANVDRPGSWMRGLVSTTLNENPQALAGLVEILGHQLPEGEWRDSFLSASSGMKEKFKSFSPEQYKKIGPQSVFDIKGFDDAATWLGETSGSALGSSIPSILAGAGGGLLAGPVGMGVGIYAASYGMNANEVYEELKKNGVPAERASTLALMATVPIAGLDTLSVIPIIGSLAKIGTKAVSQEAMKSLARRVLEEVPKAGLREAGTEAAQDAIKTGAVSYETGKPLATIENAKSLIDAAAAGAVGGAGMGPLAAVRSPNVAGTTPTAGDVEAVAREIQAGLQQGQVLATGQAQAEALSPLGQASAIAAPNFYSPLLRAAEERAQNGSPDQVLATLRNTPGVKQEEIEATGLAEWLSTKKGKVTKDQLLEYLEEKQIQVEEVVYGDPDSRPKYEGYALEGPKKNYREILLTLPKKQSESPKLEQRHDNTGIKYVVTYEGKSESFNTLAEAEDVVNGYYNDFEQKEKEDFQSAHWGPKNIIAHLRLSERVDASGQPVLHVEEIQSDWHQKGRDNQYHKSYAEYETNREAATQGFENARNNLHQALLGLTQQDRGRAYDWLQEFSYAAAEAQYNPRFLNQQRVALSNTFEGDSRVPEVLKKVDALVKAVDEQQKAEQSVPDAPFKSSWSDLAMKRLLRYVADNGGTRITFQNGADMFRLVASGGNEKQKAGLAEFYDRIIPSKAKKWAKEFGGSVGKTELDVGQRNVDIERQPDGSFRVYDYVTDETFGVYNNTDEANIAALEFQQQPKKTPVFYLDVPPTAATKIQQGLALFSRIPGMARVTIGNMESLPVEMQIAARQMANLLGRYSRMFRIEAPVKIMIEPTLPPLANGMQAGGWLERMSDGSYQLRLNVGAHPNPESLYATAMHEFGHLIAFETFARAPAHIQLQIREAYKRFREQNPDTTQFQTLLKRRDNAIIMGYGMRGKENIPLYAMNNKDREYWAGFDEWFAEQVARWATTDAKPLGVVERFFSRLGQRIRAVVKAARDHFGLPFNAPQEMANWLNSFIDTSPSLGATTSAALDKATKEANQRAIDLFGFSNTIEAAPQQPESTMMRQMFSSLGMGTSPHAHQQVAMVDKLSWFTKLTASIYQILERNPHIEPLQRYVENIRQATNEQNQILDRFTRVRRMWEDLGPQGNDPLIGFIDDITNMVYRTPVEVLAGVARHPTPQEVQTLVTKHGVTAEGLKVFREINRLFDGMLTLQSNLAREAANSIMDPVARGQRLNELNAAVQNLRNKPYFPFMRFGRHYVTVKNARGHIIYREHVERRGLKNAERVQKALVARLKQSYPANQGFKVEPWLLDEQAVPLLGIPAIMLDLLDTKLNLTPQQRDALEHLRYEMSPAQSFKHRFQHKSYTKGYSRDFKRAFANYGFHGALWYKKAKFADRLRQAVKDTRESSQLSSTPITRQHIANMMTEHLEKNFLNPVQDLLGLKSAVVFWLLGFVPASAVVNLTQTPLVTAPFLGAKFGDLVAARAMARAMTKWSNFYKKGHYDSKNMNDFENRAMGYAIQTGRVDNTIAVELAAWGNGSNMQTRWGASAMHGMLQAGMDKAMWMFEIAEKLNRRIAFMAALDLAQKYPNVKYMKETLPKYKNEIARMVASGFYTQAEAEAVVMAAHIVDQTQFIASYEARPRVMRGKLGSLFLFMKFLQGMLFANLNNKRDFLPRFVVLMLGVGGLMGIPGYDDLEEIAKVIGWRLFGKNYNLSHEIHKFVKEVTGSDTAAEVALNGTARMGFGVPWIMDLLGQASGMWRMNKIPGTQRLEGGIDMSRSVGTGLIVPVEWGKLFGPPLDPTDKVLGTSTVRSLGAMGSVANNMYKFASSKDSLTDMRRIELAMPRFARQWSKAFRAYQEGAYTTQKGDRVATVNVRDTEHLAELLNMGLGFQPTRLSRAWDQERNFQEIMHFLDMQRKILLDQRFAATKIKNETKQKEEFDRVEAAIREFNDGLPQWAKEDVKITKSGKLLTAGFQILEETKIRSMRARAKAQEARESGIPLRVGVRGLRREMQRLYPAATVIDGRKYDAEDDD